MIIKALLAAYKRWPLRPHCAPPRHVRLCLAFNPVLPPSMKCPDAPDIPVPNPLPRR
jgi:hypothetical protein